MGTRGAYGFHKNGIDKITYNHYDSYPTGLGDDIKKFISNHSIDDINKIFNKIKMVKQNSKPTKKQVESCKKYANVNVSKGTVEDWYCLLREAQGNLEAYADDLAYMIDGGAFLKESLFCEWGYVINLDTNVLEIYRGFQTKPQLNRYFSNEHTDNIGEYYNCALVKEVPLGQVKDFDMEQFEQDISKQEDEND